MLEEDLENPSKPFFWLLVTLPACSAVMEQWTRCLHIIAVCCPCLRKLDKIVKLKKDMICLEDTIMKHLKRIGSEKGLLVHSPHSQTEAAPVPPTPLTHLNSRPKKRPAETTNESPASKRSLESAIPLLSDAFYIRCNHLMTRHLHVLQ